MSTPTTVEEVSRLPLVLDALPGEPVPYAVAAGEGRRSTVGGMLVTEVARPADTGGAFAAAWISGPLGAAVPATRADEHLFAHVLDGVLDVVVDGAGQRLTGGDTVRVGPGSSLGWNFAAHTGKVLLYTTRGIRQAFLTAAASATAAHVHRSEGEAVPEEVWARAARVSGAQLVDDAGDRPGVRDLGGGPVVPAAVVRAGDGERWASYGQVNSYLARGRDTGSAYFAVHTRGARSPWIPRHRHHLHTENFLCLDGRVRLEANGTELLLTRGDFVHAPAGTVHSFSFDRPDTQMLGLLTTDVFEPFFEHMNEPTQDRTFDESGRPWFPEEGFARVRAELDVEVVGPPPGD